MSGYHKRLERDLDRWIANGLVDASRREAILADAAPEPSRWSAAGAAAILGAVLLALAALTFVAANWAEIPRLVRFAILLAAMWAAFGGAAFAFKKGAAPLGHALAVLGAALFGAGLFLTAQTFNLASFRPIALGIWAGAALIMALAIASRPALILSSLITVLWIGAELASPYEPGILWGFLPVWLAAAFACARLKSRAAANLLSLSLLFWMAVAVWRLDGAGYLDTPHQPALLALACLGLALGAARASDRPVFGAGILMRWMAAGAALSGWATQIALGDTRAVEPSVFFIGAGGLLLAAIFALALWSAPRLSMPGAVGIAGAAAALAGIVALAGIGPDAQMPARIALGALVFALAAGLAMSGARQNAGFIGGLGVALFGVQALYVYTTLLGTLLDTALFFFIGGVLMLALSGGAVQWRRVSGRFADRRIAP